MRNFLRNVWEDKRGNSLIIAAATLPLLLGSAGLATDTIQWALWKRQLQRAADSAAIAGVYAYVAKNASADVPTAVSKDLVINNHTSIDLAGGYPQVSYPGDNGDLTKQVKVTLAVQRKLSFSAMFLPSPPLIKTSATAAAVPGVSEFCVVSLESNGANSGITVSGNAGIRMDCSFMTNSPSNNSAYAKGSAEVYAKSVSSVGGIQESTKWHVDHYEPYSPPLTDPFKDVKPNPSDMKCGGKWKKQGNNNVWEDSVLDENTDLNTEADANGQKANCFTSLSVASGKTLTLPPGTYYINGGDAFVQGNLNCSGCTIVLTNKSTADTASIGQFKVNASSAINMTASQDGQFKGIAIYQDRRAKDSQSATNKINGNSNSIVQGALYFPNQQLDYNGGGTTTAVCTLFVSRRINFTGNSGTFNQFKKGSECAGFGLPTVEGGRRVRLVG